MNHFRRFASWVVVLALISFGTLGGPWVERTTSRFRGAVEVSAQHDLVREARRVPRPETSVPLFVVWASHGCGPCIESLEELRHHSPGATLAIPMQVVFRNEVSEELRRALPKTPSYFYFAATDELRGVVTGYRTPRFLADWLDSLSRTRKSAPEE